MVSSALGIPDSPNTVSVKMIQAATGVVPATIFFEPVHADNPLFVSSDFCFLIEHSSSGKRVMFDLGVRADPANTSAPAFKKLLTMGVTFVVEKDASTQLVEGGVPLESIDAIIWSHSHNDHTGDPSVFPSSTDLVVGPGFSANVLPLYPTNPESSLLENDIAGRKLIEIAFEDDTAKIAGFKSYDYFGDGSLYLLDTPGHCHGHIAALARVTAGSNSKSTFLLLGGDLCHHAGQLRPSPSKPCPPAVLSRVRAQSDLNFDIQADTPPLTIQTASHGVHSNAKEAIETLKKVQLLDGDEDVFVILAHDASLVAPGSPVQLFPAELNGWKEGRWKEKLEWTFLERDNPAFRFAAGKTDAGQ